MNVKEKEGRRIYDLFNVKAKPNFLCLPYKNIRKVGVFFTEKELFKENRRGSRIEKRKKKKKKRGGFTVLTTTIKKDSTTSKRKHANGLKVDEKTVEQQVNKI